jgi:crotonobetainyl-CoA:carnitine CoA-transferase CaiB-like acyl-CoA transferase
MGLREIEVGESSAVSYCGKLLSDLGAEVIKVESADAPTRHDAGFLPTMAASTSRRISMNST